MSVPTGRGLQVSDHWEPSLWLRVCMHWFNNFPAHLNSSLNTCTYISLYVSSTYSWIVAYKACVSCPLPSTLRLIPLHVCMHIDDTRNENTKTCNIRGIVTVDDTRLASECTFHILFFPSTRSKLYRHIKSMSTRLHHIHTHIILLQHCFVFSHFDNGVTLFPSSGKSVCAVRSRRLLVFITK